MRLVITSDTHGKHNPIGSHPDGDVFVRAGRLVKNGYLRRLDGFELRFLTKAEKLRGYIAHR